jgi:hypothetical protein
VLRRIVNSQALRFEPFSKLERLLHALTSVSWTRSSARVGFLQSEFAKARSLGTAPISRVCSSRHGTSASLQLLEKLDETVGNRLADEFAVDFAKMLSGLALNLDRVCYI